MAVLTIASSLVLTTLISADGAPFQQSSWPTPKRGSGISVGVSTTPGTSEAAPPPANPFTQSHWPAPQRLGYIIIGVSSRPNPAETIIQPSPDRPFFQADWPVQRRRVLPTTGFLTYYVVDANSPFAQTTWPNPRTKRQSPELMGMVEFRI
jgi:hypothetical protein